MVIEISPTISEVSLAQAVSSSPAALPTGTRPEAIPPTTVPRKNGTRSEDSANTAPSTRRSAIVAASPRRANAAPRRMIPTAARNSGMAIVDMIEPNASGKAVHMITRMKISHTWLASHTGDIEFLMRARSASSRAVRSQIPVPKSAPPNTR